MNAKDMKTRKKKQSTKRWICVASRAESGCWSGGVERWRVAWWDNEQHLSPINSLYLSPSFCAVTAYLLCLTIWWVHLLLYGLYFMKIIFCCHPLLFISFSGTGDSWQQPPFWKLFHSDWTRLPLRDEQKTLCFQFYCSDSVSELLHCPFP